MPRYSQANRAQIGDVTRKGGPALAGNRNPCVRLASHEVLLDDDVTCTFQRGQVCAEIAVRGVKNKRAKV
jgi:hypothetical protein